VSPNKYPGVVFFSIVFGSALIGLVYMALYGVPTNALHVSITSGCFGVIFAVIIAFGAPNIVGMWKQ
jgi:hypothetical protein